ncbi:MAG TPA: T9SS type A sorting domain-containing protein, partial [Ignavibacteriaceae bacterium]
FNPADTSFLPTGVIIPLGSNYAVNRDLSVAVTIQGDTSLEIFNPVLVNTIDISKIKNPESAFIDSPYVYIHQTTLMTGVIDENSHPSGYELQVYPNPFNPSANIIYTMPERSNVEIRLYDMLGREVKYLYHGESDAGSHKLILNGSGLASGIYLVRLETGNYFKTQKVILLK